MVPNLFASSDPGDLFVIRNVGNLIAPAGNKASLQSNASEPAAIEFALPNLASQDIIVCGHSECGTMHALLRGRNAVEHRTFAPGFTMENKLWKCPKGMVCETLATTVQSALGAQCSRNSTT